jgi:lipopolysaccharide transport system permease protein
VQEVDAAVKLFEPAHGVVGRWLNPRLEVPEQRPRCLDPLSVDIDRPHATVQVSAELPENARRAVHAVDSGIDACLDDLDWEPRPMVHQPLKGRLYRWTSEAKITADAIKELTGGPSIGIGRHACDPAAKRQWIQRVIFAPAESPASPSQRTPSADLKTPRDDHAPRAVELIAMLPALLVPRRMAGRLEWDIVSNTPPTRRREPVVRIRPAKGWIGLDIGELWRFRELFGFLVWRDLKIKYRQTLLGVGWAILVPFLQMVIFSFVFGRVAKLPTDGLPGPLFYISALIPWTYFATSVSMSSNALVGNAHMVTKIYFPRLILPASPCIAALADFSIAFALLLVAIVASPLVFGVYVPFTAYWLLIPVLVVIAFGTSIGVGLALSALNVKYRDIKYVVPFLIQLWMYVTVILPFSELPHTLGVWRWLYGLNPMAGVVEGFRWCLFHPIMSAAGRPVAAPWALLALGSVAMMAMVAYGLFYFKRTEKLFADVV